MIKSLFLLVLFLFSQATFAQTPTDGRNDALAEARMRKQLAVMDLENQIKAIPYAGVRVYARYRVASWLWKDGKDDTGRAVDIAVTAIEDHQKNRNEIPSTYNFNAHLFVLLDAHAKETAKQLRDKYKLSSEDESRQMINLLGQEGGEKKAVDAAISSLSQGNDIYSGLTYVLVNLEKNNSLELNRLLLAIIAAEETGTNRMPTHMIEILTGFIIKPAVPDDLRHRFIRLIITRSLNVAALSELDRWVYYRTLNRLWPDISKVREFLAEASTAYTILSARVSQATREGNERYDRIQNSADKLSAAIAEAERAEDETKYSLYRYAARLALEAKKFVYAIDLMEKASDVNRSRKATEKEKDFEKSIFDQFYRGVVSESLKANEPDPANYAVNKMNSPQSKADSLARIAIFYIDRHDLDSARLNHDEASRLITKAEASAESIGTLIRMLPTAQKIDQDRVRELSQIIARSINAIPSLNVEDKPETDKYKAYVMKVMIVNWNLNSALIDLVKSDRNAAADLAGRIEKKEIRIVADAVMLMDSIDGLLTHERRKPHPL